MSASPTTEVRPRPVFSVTAPHYRDRATAEAVCAGRFTELGRTLELGVEPDWLGAELPDDVEWRIAWSKFYYGLDLAHAFRETGERRFLDAWERLVRSWIRRVPVGADTSDTAARRMQNWVYAWDVFARSPAFDGLADGLADELVRALAADARDLRARLTRARNHRTLELYALFVVALALPVLDDGLLDFAIGRLHENLLADVRADGVHCEASTHYHLVVLRSFVGLRENARRFGLRLPADFDGHLALACDFAMHAHRPDGGIAAFSDADGGSYLDVLALAADLLDRDDLRFVATRGAAGREPAVRNAVFADGGYVVQRSGWDLDARWLMFDCGPLGEGGHGHYDLLSFELAAGGRPLIVDPGRHTYSEAAEDGVNLRHWFKGTAAHNTVCVDGLDQTPYRAGKPRGEVAQGRLLGVRDAPGRHVACAEATSPCYDAVHRRRVTFVDGAHWVIEDDLRARSPHRYELRFHLTPEARDAVSVSRTSEGWRVEAPGLALVFGPQAQPVVEDGWVAPVYGIKLRAPVVSVAVEGVADAHFVTRIVPNGAARS